MASSFSQSSSHLATRTLSQALQEARNLLRAFVPRTGIKYDWFLAIGDSLDVEAAKSLLLLPMPSSTTKTLATTLT